MGSNQSMAIEGFCSEAVRFGVLLLLIFHSVDFGNGRMKTAKSAMGPSSVRLDGGATSSILPGFERRIEIAPDGGT
jgi:hypothetical protein